MMRVKFRKSVPEEIRQHVREFMRGKTFYEADTGMAASLAPLCYDLTQAGYYWEYHVDHMEIMTIEEWVGKEIKEYPDAYSRYILFDHLARIGIPLEKINQMMGTKSVL